MQKYQAAIISKKSNQPDINWTDFNWPPLIRIFHFDLSELQEPYRGTVRLLYISYLLIFGSTIFNLLDCIIQGSVGYPKIRILYGFLNIFIFNGIQMYIFYRGYKGLCADQSLLKVYKIMHLVAGIWWFIVSIIGVLGWNGFTRSATLSNDGYGGLVFLSVMESLGYLFSFLLSLFCVYKVHTFTFDTNQVSEPI